MNDKEPFAFEDDPIQRCLLQIARTHVKLALEYGEPHTSSERKEEIRQRIESLRMERDQLMSRPPEEETGLIPRMT